MLKTTFGRTGSKMTLAAALGVMVLASGQARAASTSSLTPSPSVIAATPGLVNANLVYNTSGTVGTSGVTGPSVISFVPVKNSAAQTPTGLSLGTFVVAPLPNGQTAVYNNTPFAISYATQSINGVDVLSTQPLLTITGTLNGTVTGSDQSGVVATFDPITKPSFEINDPQAGHFIGSLSLPSPQRTLVPSTTFSGQSTAEGYVIVTNAVPEPATIALFLAAGAGLGLRRRFKIAR